MLSNKQFINVFVAHALCAIRDRFYGPTKEENKFRIGHLTHNVSNFFKMREAGFRYSCANVHTFDPELVVEGVHQALKELNHPLHGEQLIFTGLSVSAMNKLSKEELQQLAFDWSMEASWLTSYNHHLHAHDWISSLAYHTSNKLSLDDVPMIVFIVICDLLAVFGLHDNENGWKHLRGSNIGYKDDVVYTLISLKQGIDHTAHPSVAKTSSDLIHSICSKLPNNEFNCESRAALIEASRKLANDLF